MSTYKTSSNDDINYDDMQQTWISKITTTIKNNESTVKFIETKPRMPIKQGFKPFGTFMAFDQDTYLQPKYVDLNYTPSAGFKKINNSHLYMYRTDKHNRDVIKSVMYDLLLLDNKI